MKQVNIHNFDVTFVGDHYRITRTVQVSAPDDEARDVAIRKAVAIVTDQLDFDPAAYARDIYVEVAF